MPQARFKLISAMEISLARDLMIDEEWAFFEHFILTIRTPNGCKPASHRLVLDGIFWISRTGAPWQDLPEEFGKWSSVYRQFRRWTLARLWEDILDALNQRRAVPDTLKWSIEPSSAPIISRRVLKEDSATRFWPLMRWVHDEDPPPCQCAWVANENRDQAGANVRLPWL